MRLLRLFRCSLKDESCRIKKSLLLEFVYDFWSEVRYCRIYSLYSLDIYWLCNALEWDTVEYATRHLYFPCTHEPLGSCVYKENTSDKWHVPRTVSNEKALHNYFIPCLNLRKTYGNFGKSSEISAIFQKLRKRFKPVFERLKRFMKLLENFGNSSEVFSR